jgi:hypothetical protein
MRTKTCIILLLAASLIAAAFVSAAADAPGVRILDSLKDVYVPVKFDHQKHTMIASSCAACHHEHGMGDGLPCKQCHALTPETFKRSVSHGFMPCRNCHGAFDRDAPRMPGLKTAYHRQCFTCHRGMGNIGSSPKGCAEICHAKRQLKTGSMRREP